MATAMRIFPIVESSTFGREARQIRVTDGEGAEMLFVIYGPGGEAIEEGAIEEGASLVLPIECEAQSTATYYVYFDNPSAGPVPDHLKARPGLVNGSVELGRGDTPDGWRHDAADEEHRAIWNTENPRSGKRCLKTIVAPGAEAQSWRTVTKARQLSGEESLDVHVKYGAGRFQVRPGDPGSMYRMELTYDEDDFDPVSSFDGSNLVLGVDGHSGSINLGKGENRSRMDLWLSPNVPTDLRLEFGAVEADVELGGIPLTSLVMTTGASESNVAIAEPNPEAMRRAELEVGAAEFSIRHLGNLNAERISIEAAVGDLTLDFTGNWRRNAEVEVQLGLGALELTFPRDVGVKLIRDTFLVSLEADDFVKNGDEYFSENWDDAEIRVTVDVDAAFGSIEVRWVQ